MSPSPHNMYTLRPMIPLFPHGAVANFRMPVFESRPRESLYDRLAYKDGHIYVRVMKADSTAKQSSSTLGLENYVYKISGQNPMTFYV